MYPDNYCYSLRFQSTPSICRGMVSFQDKIPGTKMSTAHNLQLENLIQNSLAVNNYPIPSLIMEKVTYAVPVNYSSFLF